VKHALSAIQYRPRKSSFKVESTGKYLRKSLRRVRTFNPFAYVMTKEVRQAEESREKTLCLDLVVAKPVPRVAGESVLLLSVSAMLTKCYNKFLFIAKCMEKGDERAIWAMLKDGVFSTADSLTRIQDLRVEVETGSSAYSTRASAEVGLIREKAKERWRKTLGKPGSFFRKGGGTSIPPTLSYQTVSPDVASLGVYGIAAPEDDFMGTNILADPYFGGVGGRGRGGITNRFPQRNQGRFMARGSERPPTGPWGGSRDNRGVRGRRGGSSFGGVSGRVGSQGAGASWGDSGGSESGGRQARV
jgi:hypothetical protein